LKRNNFSSSGLEGSRPDDVDPVDWAAMTPKRPPRRSILIERAPGNRFGAAQPRDTKRADRLL